jgi:hypothetical protein
MPAPLVVVLVQAGDVQRGDYVTALSQEGYRVRSVAAESVDLDTLLGTKPALVAAEFVPGHSDRVIELARRFRAVPTTRRIPFVIYGRHLGSGQIERLVRDGALWLQVAPSDSAKLVAAVRGVLAVSSP